MIDRDIMVLFKIMATAGMDRDKDVRLEARDYEHDSNAVGNLTKGHTVEYNLSLNVFSSMPEDESEEEEEDAVE